MKTEIELQINHIEKHFPMQNKTGFLEVLKDINFTVNKGDFICIAGGSGCGKSTLLRLIAGLETPDNGSVLLHGTPVQKPSVNIGFIFQENRLLPWLNVEKNVMFGISGNYSKQEKKTLAEQYLELVGLQEYRTLLPQQLSGGMKQRVNIARTLVNKPEILLLDEPFSALDAFTRMKLQEELIHIWQKNHTTMLLVTHDIDEAVYLGNQVIVMSAKPGVIKNVHNIQLPRPRIRTDENFLYYRNQIYQDFFGKEEKEEDYVI